MLRAIVAAAAAGVSSAGPWAPAQCAGALPVTIDGAAQTWQVVTFAGAKGVAADGMRLSVAHNDRAYLVSECTAGGSFSADLFATNFKLLGSRFNFTFNLGNSGCGCNLSLYLVSMPGYDSSGNPNPGEGDGYCDANDVGNQWCPEIDVIEANTAALAVTPHNCSAPANKHYSRCDKGGCSVNPHKSNPTLFGPGSSFTIDSTRAFVVSTVFPTDPATGMLAAMTTTISQGGASFVLSHTDANCGAGYLAAMTAPLASGMVPTFSVWGDSGPTMSWLDEPPCDAATSCNSATAGASYTDLSITKL